MKTKYICLRKQAVTQSNQLLITQTANSIKTKNTGIIAPSERWDEVDLFWGTKLVDFYGVYINFIGKVR